MSLISGTVVEMQIQGPFQTRSEKETTLTISPMCPQSPTPQISST